jgi:hypothetical protein
MFSFLSMTIVSLRLSRRRTFRLVNGAGNSNLDRIVERH